MKPAYKIKGESAVFDLPVAKHGLESILGAAYLLTDRAYAWLEGDKAKKLTVTLRLRKPGDPKELAETFLRELETQKVRWAIAKNNLPVREFIAEQAVLLANGKLPPPEQAPQDELSDDQRKEIEKLIAEVEEEIKTMSAKKAPSDPKGIAATWEEKQAGGKA